MGENQDLHGSAPDTCPTALVLIDVINDFEFEGAESLFPRALEAAERMASLKRRARTAGMPVVYANDNFGRWRSDFREVVAHCLEDGVRGEPIVRLLRPDDDDYFVLKPKHSAFFATTLETLFAYLGVRRLILAGFATDMCVLFTAIDAYMRELELLVPRDCVAADPPEASDQVLDYLARVLRVDTTPSSELPFETLVSGPAA
jgi:nicotinamidase-related amidase